MACLQSASFEQDCWQRLAAPCYIATAMLSSQCSAALKCAFHLPSKASKSRADQSVGSSSACISLVAGARGTGTQPPRATITASSAYQCSQSRCLSDQNYTVTHALSPFCDSAKPVPSCSAVQLHSDQLITSALLCLLPSVCTDVLI